MSSTAANRLLDKLRSFIASELDDEERALLGQLLVPGIAQAYDEDEVSGFTTTEWSSHALPLSLVQALRASGVRIVGLGPS
ncbi:MAG: hypothetical protein ACRD12_21275 [Acidimicrobiales bacterium]